VKPIFDRLGLSEDEAITLFYKRVAASGRMPFAKSNEAPAKIKKTRMNERFAEWDAF
jgi:antitoxin component of RelBE/YafQ-DinJ toxin-antitoxin module